MIPVKNYLLDSIKIKSYLLLSEHTGGDVIAMQEGTDKQIRTELNTEIQTLEKQYSIIWSYLSGTEYDTTEIISTLRAFKNTLNKISAHILTLYALSGQRTKITWDSLFTNIDNALETMQSGRSKPRAAIRLALDISEPKIEEVMGYLASLRQSLQ